jgi:hypothetical protein
MKDEIFYWEDGFYSFFMVNNILSLIRSFKTFFVLIFYIIKHISIYSRKLFLISNNIDSFLLKKVY